MFRQLLVFLWVLACPSLFAQVTYSANDQITPYSGSFHYGSNLSNYPPWTNAEVGNIAAGNDQLNIQGIGVQSFRNSLQEHFLEEWGYDIRLADFQHWEGIGMEDHLTIIGYPSDDHRDFTQYCSGVESELFANMYEPIWDGGANGTPVNENNYYANYVYQLVNQYGDFVKFYEVWNEPDFSFSGNAWLPPGNPNSWWDSNPNPCDYSLAAPIFHYIRLLRISYEVIKTVDPTAYVGTGGLGNPAFLDAILRNTDNPSGGSINNDYPLTGGAYFDVMSYHSYPHIDGSMWEFPAGGGLNYFRHSDKGVEGMLARQTSFRTVLESHGYDGSTYPEKLWFLSETMVPRKQFNNYIGSEEAQVNYIMKALTEAQRNDFVQVDVFTISEISTFEDAWNEYLTMGLFEHLSTTVPYEFTLTEAGKAYHTMNLLLPSLPYDAAKTDAMNLPAGVKGAAFEQGNAHVFILWAETSEDQSEVASASYAIPSSFGLDEVEIYNYDYSSTGIISMGTSDNIALTGTPVIISEGGGTGIAPTAGISVDIPFGCAPLVVQFSDASEGEPTAWEWTFEGGNITSSTDPSPNVTYLNPGQFGVTLTVSNAFGSNTVSENPGVEVDVPPVAAFDLAINEFTVQFTNNSIDGNLFLWTFSDGQMSMETNPTITFAENGNYSATLEATNDCGTVTISDNFLIDVSATNEINGLTNWAAYPNPTDGLFSIALEGAKRLDLQLIIYDVFGKAIHAEQFRKPAGTFAKLIELEDFASGLYFLKLEVGEEFVFEKIIVK